jgi:group I intron endonuclease
MSLTELDVCDIIGNISLANAIKPSKDITKISGIYKIINQVNNKFYLGSSKDFFYRWYKHRSALLLNKHHSILLQRAFNKYTENVFICQGIEECNEEILLEREQYYLDMLMPWKPEIGYNISSIACGVNIWKHNPNREELRKLFSQLTLGKNNPMYGKHHSEATKQLIRERSPKFGKNNGRWIEVNDDIKQQIIVENSKYGLNSSMRLGKQLGLGWRVVHRILGKTY